MNACNPRECACCASSRRFETWKLLFIINIIIILAWAFSNRPELTGSSSLLKMYTGSAHAYTHVHAHSLTESVVEARTRSPWWWLFCCCANTKKWQNNHLLDCGYSTEEEEEHAHKLAGKKKQKPRPHCPRLQTARQDGLFFGPFIHQSYLTKHCPFKLTDCMRFFVVVAAVVYSNFTSR